MRKTLLPLLEDHHKALQMPNIFDNPRLPARF
jgi:hypothetical protein